LKKFVKNAKFKLMKKALIALFLLFMTNMGSLYYSWYLRWDWFDTIQHFLGGFFVAILMTAYLKDHLISGNKLKNILIIAGATVFIGVVWEFSEFIANQTLVEPTRKYFGIDAYFMGDLADTMTDLLLDMLGAFALFAIHSLWRRNSH